MADRKPYYPFRVIAYQAHASYCRGDWMRFGDREPVCVTAWHCSNAAAAHKAGKEFLETAPVGSTYSVIDLETGKAVPNRLA